MRINNIFKKIMASSLVTVMVLAGVLVSPTDTAAAETTYGYEDKIIYTDAIKNAVYLYNEKEAPTKAGYVFGGWFSDENGVNQVEAISVSGGTTLYAKFVPAYVLSVKAQNHQDIVKGGKKGNLRIISGVDNADHYSKVGFDVYLANKEDLYGNLEGETVYTKITVNTTDTDGNAKKLEYEPEQVFGEQAHFFNIAEIQNVNKKNFEKTIYVRPYWITNDGTKVYGLAKYVCVQDGLDGIISIPINLYTAQAIPAGIVEVTYPEQLTYIEDDGYTSASRLLSEMAVAANTNTRTIKCAGNVASKETGDLAANTDLYVSLRFKVADAYKDLVVIGKTRLNFTINSTQFCNWSEEFVGMSDYVWDIQY